MFQRFTIPMSLIFVLVISLPLEQALFAQQPTTTTFGRLDEKTAAAWSDLVLENVDIEFPNKMSLVYIGADQLKTPKENFPAFYGCFDWHSSVHGHWVLARLLRTVPDLPNADRIRASLNEHLSESNLVQEAAFFGRDEHKSFERMYGWAWLLKLATELDKWDDPDGRKWRENIRPLENLIIKRTMDYLPLLSFPIRIGQHTDTGFALGQLHDYAVAIDRPDLAKRVTETANRFYSADVNYPVSYEPSGHDFFSSCWNEADLMRRLLPQDAFVAWLDKFVPDARTQLEDGTIEPVEVSDVTDGKLVHLAGLNLSRAWCLRAVSLSLPDGHQLKTPLLDSAQRHLDAGIAYVNSGHYEGDHWLATFALYAITE